MLDLNVFEDLLFRYDLFLQEATQNGCEAEKVKLRFPAHYEVTFPCPEVEVCKLALQKTENTVHQFLNDVELLLGLNDRSTYPYFFQKQVLAPAVKVANHLKTEIALQSSNLTDNNKDRQIILEILQHYLVWLLAEVLIKSAEYLGTDELCIPLIYEQFMEIQEPTPSIIYDRINKMIPPLQSTVDPVQILKPSGQKLTLEQIIQSPEHFINVEELLMENELIDSNHCFINTYGNRKYLAAVYLQLINKSYFQKYIFPGRIEVRTYEIRNFLDERYGVKLQKQCSYWINHPSEHTAFIAKYFWLENLQHCSSV